MQNQLKTYVERLFPMTFKGIVHPKMKIWCLSAYPKGIQDVGDYVSSVEHKRRFLTQTVAVCQSYNVSQLYSQLWERKKTYTDKTKLNPAARDDTLRSLDTKRSVCARNWTVFISSFTSDLPPGPTVLSDRFVCLYFSETVSSRETFFS